MTLIDLLKVLTPDTKIVLQYQSTTIFEGETEIAMIELTLEEVEMTIHCVWFSENLYKAIVVELE